MAEICYSRAEENMTDRLDKAIAEIRRLPPKRQDEAAEMLLEIAAQDASDLRLSPEQLVDLEQRLAEPPDYASDDEVEAFFKRFAD